MGRDREVSLRIIRKNHSMSAHENVFQPVPVPLRLEASGAIRIGETRVLLELVIHAFQDGSTPEAIVHDYDTLDLADVYAVIAYYLKHRQDVENYLAAREKIAIEIQKRFESQQPDLSEIRKRLMARRKS